MQANTSQHPSPHCQVNTITDLFTNQHKPTQGSACQPMSTRPNQHSHANTANQHNQVDTAKSTEPSQHTVKSIQQPTNTSQHKQHESTQVYTANQQSGEHKPTQVNTGRRNSTQQSTVKWTQVNKSQKSRQWTNTTERSSTDCQFKHKLLNTHAKLISRWQSAMRQSSFRITRRRSHSSHRVASTSRSAALPDCTNRPHSSHHFGNFVSLSPRSPILNTWVEPALLIHSVVHSAKLTDRRRIGVILKHKSKARWVWRALTSTVKSQLTLKEGWGTSGRIWSMTQGLHTRQRSTYHLRRIFSLRNRQRIKLKNMDFMQKATANSEKKSFFFFEIFLDLVAIWTYLGFSILRMEISKPYFSERGGHSPRPSATKFVSVRREQNQPLPLWIGSASTTPRRGRVHSLNLALSWCVWQAFGSHLQEQMHDWKNPHCIQLEIIQKGWIQGFEHFVKQKVWNLERRQYEKVWMAEGKAKIILALPRDMFCGLLWSHHSA